MYIVHKANIIMCGMILMHYNINIPHHILSVSVERKKMSIRLGAFHSLPIIFNFGIMRSIHSVYYSFITDKFGRGEEPFLEQYKFIQCFRSENSYMLKLKSVEINSYEG